MKIDRIERQIKNLERVAGSAYNTFSKRNTALRNQISSITEEISTQQAGYDRYIQQANSVSLSENYKSQVRNGAIDISTITDETLAENIKEYQQWWIFTPRNLFYCGEPPQCLIRYNVVGNGKRDMRYEFIAYSLQVQADRNHKK